MLAISIGQRYEKLLFWAAPITLATVAVLLIQLGYQVSKPINEARCIVFALERFEERLPNLNRSYEVLKRRNTATRIELYKGEFEIALLSHPKPQGCDKYFDAYLAANIRKSPSDIFKDLAETEKRLRESPVSLFGIEIPQATQFNLAGNTLKAPVPLLALVAQIALLPIMLLWLGSLYHTRFREAVLVNRASTIAQVFPHLINLFPVGKLDSPKKREMLVAHQATIIGLFFSFLRFSLLTVFILPPTAAYVWSLWISANEDNFVLPLIAAFLVACFFVQTAFFEFSEPLFTKLFSDEDRYSAL